MERADNCKLVKLSKVSKVPGTAFRNMLHTEITQVIIVFLKVIF